MAQPDPMLSMLEWLCAQLMEAEVSSKLSAEKNERADERSGYRCGYRPRRLNTRMGTMYLMIPKVRQGGYIPFFITERNNIDTGSTGGLHTGSLHKEIDRLANRRYLKSQVSEMTKGLNEQVEMFRSRSLSDHIYPVVWADALYEKVRVDGRVVSDAVIVVCGVDENGHRNILVIEPVAEESEGSYSVVFDSLKERGLLCPN